ncbi:hypothetical protein ANCDUO_01958 [Ancylostoma duodenale]|uniref:Uncharacterized protein n=1 Tax=Ancylostoma duodenale TaxID=51022 RepID=A0A0C2DCX5_9BILA|nr:hypothetical protein ANCDUO_01958 [Ancylostoma duodenale]
MSKKITATLYPAGPGDGNYIYLMTYGCERTNFYLQPHAQLSVVIYFFEVIEYIDIYGSGEHLLEMPGVNSTGPCVDVKAVTSTIALYYRFKPVDWILDDMLRSRYCALGEPHEKCLAISSHISQSDLDLMKR